MIYILEFIPPSGFLQGVSSCWRNENWACFCINELPYLSRIFTENCASQYTGMYTIFLAPRSLADAG